MLELNTTFILIPLRWRRHFNVSNQRKEERASLQRPVVLANVKLGSKGRFPMRSTGTVDQPTELHSGLI